MTQLLPSCPVLSAAASQTAPQPRPPAAHGATHVAAAALPVRQALHPLPSAAATARLSSLCINNYAPMAFLVQCKQTLHQRNRHCTSCVAFNVIYAPMAFLVPRSYRKRPLGPLNSSVVPTSACDGRWQTGMKQVGADGMPQHAAQQL